MACLTLAALSSEGKTPLANSKLRPWRLDDAHLLSVVCLAPAPPCCVHNI